MRRNDIYPFVGAVTAIDPRSTPRGSANDHLNAREEDGSIKFRYGFRNLASAQSGYSAVFGLAYLQGYSGTTEKEEYVTAETISGNTRFFSRSVTTGAATEIKNGVTSVNENASEWVFNTFDSYSYFINPSGTAPVYRHSIDDATSLTAIAIPTAPANAPTYRVTYGGGSTPYTQLSWAGCDPTASGEVACTGAATNTGSSLLTDNTLSIRHTDSEIDSSFEVDMNDMTAGVQDWTYNDRFGFTLSCETNKFQIDGSSIQVQFTNNDGSPKTLIPDKKAVSVVSAGSGGSGAVYSVFIGWDDKTRADFDNVRNFKVSYRVKLASSTVANNDLILSKPFVGGVMPITPPDRSPTPDGLTVGYTYYYSGAGFESGISPTLFIPNDVLGGYQPLAGLGYNLGTHIELTATVSADTNVDNNRFYVMNVGTEKYHRVATQADSDLTYDYKMSYVEAIRNTEYSPTPFLFSGVTNMFPYKGHAVWLYKGGSQNIRFSRAGDAIRQASDEDSEDDLSAGETFTLADNYGDEPLGGAQAGDAVMIAGKYGVYTMIGDYAVQMTPPRKVSGSYGVAGKYAYTRWKDDNGTTGLAYLSRDGQVYFSVPGAFSGKEVGDTINLTALVRDGELSPKDFLLDEQASALSLTDYSTAQVFVDEQQDALWVVMGLRAMVLRRSNLLDGTRYWEHYEYNTGSSTVTLRYCSGSGKRRLRFIRSNGKFDELEWNSNTGAYITGSNSDGGSAATAGYWESKTFVGPNRRVNFVGVERDDLTDTPTVTVYSSRTTAGTALAVTSGNKGVRFTPADQGEWYRVRVTLAETYEPIRRITVEEYAAGRRRNA